MALTYPVRSYPAGAAVAGTLNGTLSSGTGAGGTFTSSSSLTGWTDVTGGSFAGDVVVAFGYGTATEEFILCTFNPAVAGGTFTIVTRGYNSGAVATTWTNAVFVAVATATEAAEWSAAVQACLTVLTNSGSGVAPGDITIDGSPSLGTGQTASAVDHDHVLDSSSLNTWLPTGLATVSTASLPVAAISGTLATVVPSSNCVTASGIGSVTNIGTNFGTNFIDSTVNAQATCSGFRKYRVTCTINMANNAGATSSMTVGYYAAPTSGYSIGSGTTPTDTFPQNSVVVGDAVVITFVSYFSAASTASQTFSLSGYRGAGSSNAGIGTNRISVEGLI